MRLFQQCPRSAWPGRLARGRKHRLDCLDSGLELLVGHRLNPSRMLDFHIPRAQQCQQLTVRCRLVLAHLSNCRWTAVPEVSEQGRNKLAVQLLAVTRAGRPPLGLPDCPG